MEIIIDSPDFNYLSYAGAIISQITYTFDVDTQSELYKFMKSRLVYAPWEIKIIVNE